MGQFDAENTIISCKNKKNEFCLRAGKYAILPFDFEVKLSPLQHAGKTNFSDGRRRIYRLTFG